MRNRPCRADRRLTLLLAATTLLLSGCMLFRIYDFKSQFCDYQANFELLVGKDIELRMLNPVLLDRDVVWLLGAEPTRRERSGNSLELVYVVEKDQPQVSDEYAIPIRLRFHRQDGDFRLEAGIIDKNLGSMVTPGLIDETVAHACDSRTNVADANVTVDLGDLDPDAVPRRSDIEVALGAPQQRFDGGRGALYRFRLRNARPGTQKSFARIEYAADGEHVERVRFHYLRYQMDADFVAGVGVISIDL